MDINSISTGALRRISETCFLFTTNIETHEVSSWTKRLRWRYPNLELSTSPGSSRWAHTSYKRGYILYMWSYGPLLVTGRLAHLVGMINYKHSFTDQNGYPNGRYFLSPVSLMPASGPSRRSRSIPASTKIPIWHVGIQLKSNVVLLGG